MTQKATIAQVAQRAGCSLATVSRVLSGSNYPVKADVRERILLCARELGYVSPSVRKPAKSRVGKDIGVLIPTLTNPFYSQLLVGVENVCEEHGYTPFFCSSHRDPEKEIENLKFFLSKSVSGIILSSINENHVFLSSLLQQDIPLVVFDQSLRELDAVSYTHLDVYNRQPWDSCVSPTSHSKRPSGTAPAGRLGSSPPKTASQWRPSRPPSKK